MRTQEEEEKEKEREREKKVCTCALKDRRSFHKSNHEVRI